MATRRVKSQFGSAGALPTELTARAKRLSPAPRVGARQLRLQSGVELRVAGEISDGVAVARAFTDAVNALAHDEAAQLLAPDVVVVFPGARLEGREAWLESRRRQQPPQHLVESVEVDRMDANEGGAELTGRLVQRWAESGEVASEMPVRIAFAVAGGAITRLELVPLAA